MAPKVVEIRNSIEEKPDAAPRRRKDTNFYRTALRAALTAGRTRRPANPFDVGLAPFGPRTSVLGGCDMP